MGLVYVKWRNIMNRVCRRHLLRRGQLMREQVKFEYLMAARDLKLYN